MIPLRFVDHHLPSFVHKWRSILNVYLSLLCYFSQWNSLVSLGWIRFSVLLSVKLCGGWTKGAMQEFGFGREGKLISLISSWYFLVQTVNSTGLSHDSNDSKSSVVMDQVVCTAGNLMRYRLLFLRPLSCSDLKVTYTIFFFLFFSYWLHWCLSFVRQK